VARPRRLASGVACKVEGLRVWKRITEDQSMAYLVLLNMDSMPKSEAVPLVRIWFIFALV